MAQVRKTILLQKSTTSAITIRQHGIEVDFTGVEEMDNGSYVNFVIEVRKDGITWEVRKRYSEFRFFQQALAEHTHHLTSEFPPKTVSSSSRSSSRSSAPLTHFSLHPLH